MTTDRNTADLAAAKPQAGWYVLGSVLLFALFSVYYLATARRLPIEAGPDYVYHNEAAAFLYEHGRLAELPRDEPSLHFSPYGGTRTLNPPFSYIVSAVTARLTSAWPADLNHKLRRGTALLGAATAAFVFYALATYFRSPRAGLIGALLLGFLPQYAFLSSYVNDDVGAIFASSVALAALIRIYRNGTTFGNWLLLSAASGLIICNKQTAWLLLPVILVFAAVFANIPLRRLPAYFGVGALVFVAGGAWWIGFNVYHYGIDDPFANNITNEIARRHIRFSASHPLSFRDFGVGYLELLLNNHNNFLGNTFISMVGNLDWLRLRVGPWQYGLYFTVLAAALAYFLTRTFLAAGVALRVVGAPTFEPRRYLLESLSFVTIALQLAAYVWTNVNNDIQVQGRYLLPAFPFLLLLALSAAITVGKWAAERWRDETGAGVRLPLSGLKVVFTFLAVTALTAIHADAMLNYIIPYYRHRPYEIEMRNFQSVPLKADAVLMRSPDVGELTIDQQGAAVRSVGDDPWFFWDPGKAGACGLVTGNFALWLEIESEQGGVMQLYVDKGEGIRERDSYLRSYDAGRDQVFFLVAMPKCRPLRLDPMRGPGMLKIRDMRIAPISIGPRF